MNIWNRANLGVKQSVLVERQNGPNTNMDV